MKNANKYLNKYDYIYLVGIALWLIETMAFGWHMEAQSVPEKMFDGIAVALMVYGGLCGLVASWGPRIIINGKEVNL